MSDGNKPINFSETILAKLAGIKMLAMDVDGILTNGLLYYSEQGEHLKTFSIKDGLGIKLLQNNGIETAIITGRSSRMVELRASELAINYVIQGREDKLIALRDLSSQSGLSMEQIAYIGDDLPDLSAIISCGFGATVSDAHSAVKEHADWVSSRNGGDAAVRELADIILHAQELYTTTIDNYLP